MTGKNKRCLRAAILWLSAFLLWTAALTVVDVRPIGPRGSAVGFAAWNGFFHSLTGVHMSLYTLTDWLGLVPVGFMMGFAVLGLVMWIRRKHIGRVDRSILVLGGFYILVTAAYLFFESFVVNFRPVLINGYLEASYPSSTTLLVLTVMPTAAAQLRGRIRRPLLRKVILAAIAVFTACMVAGRLLSGVHWFTDIVGGAFLSAGLVQLYHAFAE